MKTRFLLKVTLPTDVSNEAIKEGSLPKTVQSILADLKPEAAYFLDQDGRRSGLLFVNMEDTSQIPAIAKPWFLAFNASVEIHPAMNAEDPARAVPAIGQAVKKYGTKTLGQAASAS